MSQATQPPLTLTCAQDSPCTAGLIGTDNGRQDDGKDVFAWLGTVPQHGQTCLLEEWKIPLTVRALPATPAHQLLSHRTWHAPECLSTLFRKGHGTRFGRGMQAAWAIGSWETVLQPGLGSESRLGVQCGAVTEVAIGT